jgi:hypothetical protein
VVGCDVGGCVVGGLASIARSLVQLATLHAPVATHELQLEL